MASTDSARDKMDPYRATKPDEKAASLAGEGFDERADFSAKEPNPAADHEELAAIGAEIDHIRASVSTIAEATRHYVKRRVTENSADLIAENPIRAALWAAFAGFVIGRLSR